MEANIESNPQLSGARTFVRALDNRFALAGIEWTEARGDLARFSLLALAVALCFQLFLGGAFVVLVALSWDTSWRVVAPAVAGGVFLVGSLVMALILRRKVRDWIPFDETGNQLVRDARAIGRMVGTSRASEEESKS